MKISRSIEEWIETDSGDLRIYIECDEEGAPVTVNSIRFRVLDECGDAETREAKETLIPAEVILRVAKMLESRAGRHGYVCIEHGFFSYARANGKYKTDCPKCLPSDEEVEAAAREAIR